MLFTSISEHRRVCHAQPMRLTPNPILDAFRDLDDPSDPWGDAMGQLGALEDAMGMTLETGATIERDPSSQLDYLLEAIGFGIQGHGQDAWPTLLQTTAYDPTLRAEWLAHAYRVTNRRASYAESLGLDY